MPNSRAPQIPQLIITQEMVDRVMNKEIHVCKFSGLEVFFFFFFFLL